MPIQPLSKSLFIVMLSLVPSGLSLGMTQMASATSNFSDRPMLAQSSAAIADRLELGTERVGSLTATQDGTWTPISSRDDHRRGSDHDDDHGHDDHDHDDDDD